MSIKAKVIHFINGFRPCQGMYDAVKSNNEVTLELANSVAELTKTINRHFSEVLSTTQENAKKDQKHD